MQAIVLAAGEGSRMRPLTANRPKVMLPAGGRPLLEEILVRAKGAGIDRFVLVVGYRQETVRSHFGDGRALGVRIEYAVQDEQLGTGHALLAAESLAEDHFMVLNGDVLPDQTSLGSMIEAAGSVSAVAAKRVGDPRRYGVFLVERGLMKAVVEKSAAPPSDLANAGIYILDGEIFDTLHRARVSARGEYELTDGLNMLASRGRVILVSEISEWIEVGRPWDLLEAGAAVIGGRSFAIEGEVEPGAAIKGDVAIGPGTVVRAGSYISGPVRIGKDCDIGPNCYIRSGTCIGNDVRIGNAVEVKNCTVMDGTKIGHLSYLGDSIIGAGCNFGAGTIVSNLRHDNANVKSFVKGELVDSGRRKLGVIMGDSVKTGIHTTIYPGTVIETGYRSRPAEILKGYVKSA